MPHRSALTAALAGSPDIKIGDSSSSGSSSVTSLTGCLPKPSSCEAFPCLDCAPNDSSNTTNGISGIASSISTLDLGSVDIVGSAPNNTSVPGSGKQLADYPLHPYRRRGGKEAVLGSSLSLSESVGGNQSQHSGHYHSTSRSSLSRNYEAVIGSLPRALSREERQAAQQSAPTASPALGALQQVPRDKLFARSAEGQRLRLSMLRGSVIAFVTAGYSGKRFIFEKCRDLGVKAVVLDAPDSWAQLLEGEGVIAKFMPVDFSDAEHVFEHCLRALRSAAMPLGGLDGVTTFCEMAVPLVARLAEALGLPGNTPDAVDAARDKYATRTCLAAAGLPTPRNARISIQADVAPAAAAVGFPAVIKPVSGAASIGVIRVDDMQQLHKAYDKVVRDLSRAKVVAGALEEGSEEGEDADGAAGSDDSDSNNGGVRPAAAAAAPSGNAGAWFKVDLLLEEYLDGPEVDCDLVLSEGRAVYGAVTDNWPTVEPYFNETGSNCPSILPRQQQQELLQLSVNSVQALGFTAGVFHVEAKYTSRGPRLIEVNARMGGGCVRDTNLLVWGVDLVEEHLLCSAGIPSRPPIARKPRIQMAEYCINAKATGVLRHTHYMEHWAAHPDVIFTSYLVPAGSKVVCVADGLPTWVCELIVAKPTIKEAIDFMQQIEQQLDIPIDPLPATNGYSKH